MTKTSERIRQVFQRRGPVRSSELERLGPQLLDVHPFVAFPGVVSKLSWNIVFRTDRAAGRYSVLDQDRLVLDTRLDPPAT